MSLLLSPVEMAQWLEADGIDCIDVSTGGLTLLFI